MFNFFWKKQLTRTTPSEAIDQIVNAHIAPLLRKEGFKKTGRTWVCEFDDYSFVINAQASRWNGKETGASFTINCGVYVPSIYEQLYGMQKPKSPKYYDCVLSRTVRHNKNGQIWWVIYDNTDVTKLGSEVETKIIEQCIGWFKSINSLTDLIGTTQTNTEKGSSWGIFADALLYAKLGNREGAQHAFSLAYCKSEDNKRFQAKIISTAKKYKISP
jgi:hypothetical protein